jgi:hypothetical protein
MDELQQSLCVCATKVRQRKEAKKKWSYNSEEKRIGSCGGMCERLKQAVLKTAIPERVSGVRIPLPPPPNLIGGQLFNGFYRTTSRILEFSSGAQSEHFQASDNCNMAATNPASWTASCALLRLERAAESRCTILSSPPTPTRSRYLSTDHPRCRMMYPA